MDLENMKMLFGWYHLGQETHCQGSLLQVLSCRLGGRWMHCQCSSAQTGSSVSFILLLYYQLSLMYCSNYALKTDFHNHPNLDSAWLVEIRPRHVINGDAIEMPRAGMANFSISCAVFFSWWWWEPSRPCFTRGNLQNTEWSNPIAVQPQPKC